MGGATRFLLLVASPFSLIFHRRSSSLYRRLPLRPFTTSSSTLSPHIRTHNFILSLPIVNSSSQRRLHTQSNSIAAEDHLYANNQQHPWPEWSNFLQILSPAAELHPNIAPDDSFVSYDSLSEEFVRSATSCLAFARNRPDILGVLPRKDIVVLVENGTPFLFKSSLDTSRRMRAFLGSAGPNVLESDNAQTVDLMKYMLGYVSNPSVPFEKANYTLELIESSVRNLLSELLKVVTVGPVSHQHQVPSYSNHAPKPFGQNIEMKKGDWICPRCSFMNFARNMKCLECEEARPQRQLTGREWECPQCTFFNYGRNTVCLRCDCKRPGEVSVGTVSSSSGLGYNRGDSANNRDINSRLASNKEKSQRWFNKVSQSNTSADLTNAAADEDFPEIMPLRNGENRFVVSTRKSPLERRLSSTQDQRNLGKEVPLNANDSQNGGANINLDTSLGRRLDQIITRTSTSSATDDSDIPGQNTGIMRSNTPRSGFLQDGPSKGSNSGYVPFVPLPADKFAKKTANLNGEKVDAASFTSVPAESHDQRGTAPVRNESGKVDRSQLSENPLNEVQNPNKEKEQTTKSDGWFNRVAELHNVSDSTNAISEDDFPEIMPMRKGENKFVVSKKKDRSLTSPMYKRQMAMEEANKSTFVPFVPFPPDYFAKKNAPQPDNTIPAANSSDEASGMSPVKSDDAGQRYTNLNQEASTDNQHTGSAFHSGAQASGYQSQSVPGGHVIRNERWNTAYSEDQQTGSTVFSRAQNSGYQSQSSPGSHAMRNERQSIGPYSEDQQTGSAVYSGAQTSGYQYQSSPGNANVSRRVQPNAGSATQSFPSTQVSDNSAGSTTPTQDSQKYKREWTGKSLEGSAVKEIDPLDMSEEAKTERWFRRVAQIKDINELSQIPDEDFPSIMPMRKGVNRFVVSKRKTPLERRLTSPQYRRNLPVVSSDPLKQDDNGKTPPCYCKTRAKEEEEESSTENEVSETLYKRKNVFREMGFSRKFEDFERSGNWVEGNRWSDCGCESCVSWMKNADQMLHVVQESSNGSVDDSIATPAENVVFVHGFLSSSLFWTETVFHNLSETVKDEYRLFAVDLLGFGISPKPRACLYTLRDHVEMIEKSVIHPFQLKSFHLVAHSMGCVIALALAAKYSNCVKSITLVAPPYFPSSNADAGTIALTRLAGKSLWPPILFGSAIMSWYEHLGRCVCFLICRNHKTWEKMLKLFMRRRDLPFMVTNLTQHTHHSAWHTMHNVICGGAKFLDEYLETLSKSRIKVTVVQSCQDQVVPLECSNNIKTKVPDADVKLIANTDHRGVVLGRQKDFTSDLEYIWASTAETRVQGW